MIFGFSITQDGRSKFGVIKSTSEEVARAEVAGEVGVATDDVSIISAEEALSQFDEIAFLAPAEI